MEKDNIIQEQSDKPIINNLFRVFAHKNQVVSASTGDLIAEVFPYREDAKQVAEKISEAINGTYGTGYRPEAMKDLVTTLTHCAAVISEMLPEDVSKYNFMQMVAYNACNAAREALKNTKI